MNLLSLHFAMKELDWWSCSLRCDLSNDVCEFLLRGTSIPRERLLNVMYRCAPLGNILRSSFVLLRSPKSCNLFHLILDHNVCKKIIYAFISDYTRV